MNTPPPTVDSLGEQACRELLRDGLFRYRVGPFSVALQTSIAEVATLLHSLYGDCRALDGDAFCDFHLRLQRPNLRRWLWPQVEFLAEGEKPFAPLPLDSAFPLLEWGFNWSVATTAHQYILLHAAVLERAGITIIMPAFPGSGKSTLSAALMLRGWRLLSDEFGMVTPGARDCIAFPRCIPLKNESIRVIREFAPDAVIGRTFHKTRKGDVAHLKPTTDSTSHAGRPATVTHLIFPRFTAGSSLQLLTITKARALIKLCTNSFNYEIMGSDAFETLAELIEHSDCLLLEYSDLDHAVAWFDSL